MLENTSTLRATIQRVLLLASVGAVLTAAAGLLVENDAPAQAAAPPSDVLTPTSAL
jgi:hypothetical protein